MKRSKAGAVGRVVIFTGISSVVTQLVLIREFLAHFHGNEFIISLILFSWLILGGIGTWLARLGLIRFTATAGRLAGLTFVLIWASVLQVLILRLFRDVVFIHGTSVGFYPTLATIFAVMTPYGILDGFVLPYSLFLLRRTTPDYPGAHIYMLDNIGDVGGGALFSFALVSFFTPLQSLFLANLPLLAAAFLLLPPGRRRSPLLLAASLTSLVVLAGGLLLERASLAPLEGRLVHYQETRYGRIAVHKDFGQYTLFVDGMPLFSSENTSQAEETVHFPLSQVASPQAILFIGAEGGMLREAVKYAAPRIDYLELDARLSRAQMKFGLLSPAEGVNVINRDGRSYLRNTDTTYDAIVLNLPEPDTFQVNRFYTSEFFALVRHHLRPGGVFSFSVEGFDNYLAEAQRRKISSLYNTVSPHFDHVLILPGQKTTFLCSGEPLRADIPALLAERGIDTAYISTFFRGNVTGERIDYVRQMLDPAAPVNHDTAPYLMQIMFQQWFSKYATSPVPFMVILAAALLFYLARSRREELVLFSTGFLTMGSETMVIFIYQILFGYIYEEIGIIVTIFLAGLLPGAWYGERLRRQKTVAPSLLRSDGGLLLLLALLALMLATMAEHLPIPFFLLFGFTVSFLCGCQFPLALALGGDDNPAATRTFSADLIGAACGTLFTSLVFIPYLGVIWSIIGLIFIKGCGSLILLISLKKKVPV